MKRQKNLLMLSLLALLLGGCGQKASDTPSVSDSQVSEIGEISQVTASKPSEEPSTGKTSDEANLILPAQIATQYPLPSLLLPRPFGTRIQPT